MKLTTADAIRTALSDLSHLEECPIQLISFEQFGTRIAVFCLYVWERPGVLRKSLKIPKYVRLQFHVVTHFSMEHRLNQVMFERPDEIGPGIVEIDRAYLDEQFKPNTPQSDAFQMRLSFLDSGEIVIVFRELEIFHETQLPDSAKAFCHHEIY